MNGVISVVVPVYNVERYLAQCLDSILTQDYSKLEVILVDDGSTDTSGAICETYAARDNRVHVIHQKNSGAAAAKNAGLRAATGEYLSIVDSDDYLEPGAYSYMLQIMHQEQADVVQCALRYVFCNRQEDQILHQGRSVMESKAYLARFLEDWSCAITTDKLYKRYLFDGVFFEEGHKIDDEYFTYQAFLKPCRVVMDDHVIYNYRQRASSVMRRPEIAEQRIFDWTDAFSRRRISVAQRYPDLKRRYDVMYLCFLCSLPLRYGSTPRTIQDIKDHIKAYFSTGGTVLLHPFLWLEILRFYFSTPKALMKTIKEPEKTNDVYFP